MTTTMRLVPAGRRGQIMALVPAAAPAVGPALSGLILSGLSWRWLFIFMLPVALIALALGAWKLRNITTPEPVALDVASLALSVIGFGGLVHGLASIGESVSGHAPVAPYIPIAIGLAGLAAFVLRQVRMQRRGAAFLDVRIFATKPFTVPLLVSAAVALVAFGSQIVLPLVLTGRLPGHERRAGHGVADTEPGRRVLVRRRGGCGGAGRCAHGRVLVCGRGRGCGVGLLVVTGCLGVRLGCARAHIMETTTLPAFARPFSTYSMAWRV